MSEPTPEARKECARALDEYSDQKTLKMIGRALAGLAVEARGLGAGTICLVMKCADDAQTKQRADAALYFAEAFHKSIPGFLRFKIEEGPRAVTISCTRTPK